MIELYLSVLENQKINFIEKIKYYFEDLEEIQSLTFHKIKINSTEKKFDIMFSINMIYDSKSYIWNQHGVYCSFLEKENPNILLDHFSKTDFNIDYYIEKMNRYIYFKDLKEEFIDNYDELIFEQEIIKFNRLTLEEDCNLFLGMSTLSKIKSINLNNILKQKNKKNNLFKI